MLKRLLIVPVTLAALLTHPVPSAAQIPDPANSECPPQGWIYVVGHDGTVGDARGEFCIIVRDFNNVPIENSSAVLDFSGCDIQLCIDQLDPDVIVDCVSQTVRKLTDLGGKACFRVIGKSRSGLGCGGQPPRCVQIFADGVFLCSLSAPTFDLVNNPDGSGVGAEDLAAWLSAYFCGSNPVRADYLCDGAVGATDLARWLTVYFALGSSLNCPPPKDPVNGPKCP